MASWRSPRQRAWAVANFGLEAGLGIELSRNPELAQLWANELTEGQSRAVVLQHAASPCSIPIRRQRLRWASSSLPDERRKFSDSVFASWAQKDTEAALQWAEQLSDPAEREAALKAIRSVAPVGIGAELRLQDGYAVINRLLPGTPAELSGQLHPGDRILAIAQGNNVFVDARGLPMQRPGAGHPRRARHLAPASSPASRCPAEFLAPNDFHRPRPNQVQALSKMATTRWQNLSSLNGVGKATRFQCICEPHR